jgi:hypothetical protein
LTTHSTAAASESRLNGVFFYGVRDCLPLTLRANFCYFSDEDFARHLMIDSAMARDSKHKV